MVYLINHIPLMQLLIRDVNAIHNFQKYLCLRFCLYIKWANTIYNPEYIIIDPYSWVDIADFPKNTKVIKQQVETLKYFHLALIILK